MHKALILFVWLVGAACAVDISGFVDLSMSPALPVPASVYSAIRVQVTDLKGSVLKSHQLDATSVFDFSLETPPPSVIVRLFVDTRSLRDFSVSDAPIETLHLSTGTASSFSLTIKANVKKLAQGPAVEKETADLVTAFITVGVLAALALLRHEIVSIIILFGSKVKPQKQVITVSR